ncbi:MAG: hypothetical protein AAGF12_24680, partial [Myxococcota bacterium]
MSQQPNEFFDDLAPVVDGEEEAIRKHAELLGTSDAHREARFEGERVAAKLADAGVDYDHPADFEERLLRALDPTGDGADTSDTVPVGGIDPQVVANAHAQA